MTELVSHQPFDAPSVLDRLAPPLLQRLLPLGSMLDVPFGTLILQEGVECPFLGVVLSGRVALRLRVPELGDRLTIVTVEPGELVGWSAVVSPYRATVDAVATDATRVVAFDAAALRERLAADCELAAALLPVVLESVSHRLTTSWHQLLDVAAFRTSEPW